MKKSLIIVICIAVIALVCAYFIPNNNSGIDNKLWNDAVYTSDTQLGTGEKTLYVSVEDGEKAVTFTINTDKETVGDALKEHKLISGEEGEYGLYVKVVNGIEADYDKDKSYWSFGKDGKPMETGVDFTEFSDGDRYELKVQK